MGKIKSVCNSRALLKTMIVGISLLVLGSGLIISGGMLMAIPTLVAGAVVAITGAVLTGLANYGLSKNESAESSMLTANQVNEGLIQQRPET